MRVLVTRPVDDASETASALAARGHQTVIAPLLEIHFEGGPTIPLNGMQAILATSSNGVRAFSRRSSRRDLPLFAVGAQTAAVATSLGFSNVRSANGDGRALAEAVIARTKPENGTFLHVAGSEKPGQLAADLAARGYRVQTAALYRAVPVRTLPAALREALQAGILDAALFFSPRTAEVFADCVNGEGLGGCCRTLIACCISEAAAASLKSLTFRAVRTSDHPDQPGLLSLLD
jgi:uroporphyrinogen-III synthase